MRVSDGVHDAYGLLSSFLLGAPVRVFVKHEEEVHQITPYSAAICFFVVLDWDHLSAEKKRVCLPLSRFAHARDDNKPVKETSMLETIQARFSSFTA